MNIKILRDINNWKLQIVYYNFNCEIKNPSYIKYERWMEFCNSDGYESEGANRDELVFDNFAIKKEYDVYSIYLILDDINIETKIENPEFLNKLKDVITHAYNKRYFE